MKRLFTASLFVSMILSGPIAAGQNFFNDTTTTFYYNNGFSGDSPPIDALNFINNGTFIAQNGLVLTVLQQIPFETSSTLNYTNTGTMSANVGFRFRNNPSNVGIAVPSRSFYNGRLGIVDAASHLIIHATNIINRGTLSIGSGGVMAIAGGNVDVAESVLAVPSLATFSSFSFYPFQTNFFIPAVSVYDQNWSTTNLAPIVRQINTAALWNVGVFGTNATAPSVLAAPAPSLPAAGFTIPNASTDEFIADSHIRILQSIPLVVTNQDLSTTNVLVGSNIVKQAAFVAIPEGFDGRVAFEADGTISVYLSSVSTDPLTGITTTNTIQFIDTLAADDDRGRLLQNLNDGTYRPVNYSIDRLGSFPPFIFGPASGNNGVPNSDFFQVSGNAEQGGFSNLVNLVGIEFPTNTIITNGGIYSAYTAVIDNVISRPPNVSGGTFTNLPGSIRIESQNLDLSETKLVAQGQISIVTDHLVPSTNTLLDVDNIALDIGSTNGTLIVNDLIPDSVTGRTRGTIQAWSGFWTNTVTVIIDENYGPDTNGIVVQQPLTNVVTVIYHALILDATGMASTLPAYVYDFMAHADHVEVNDNMTLVQHLFLDARSASLNGIINVPGVFPVDPISGLTAPGNPLADWFGTNAPRLLYLTNSGTVSFPNTIHWGDDRSRFAAVVNTGTVRARSVQANSWDLHNSGTVDSLGLIDLRFNTALLTGGEMSSSNYIRLTGNNLVLTNHHLITLGFLDLRIFGVLSDLGVTNFIEVNDGFNLRTKPVVGDLLATTLSSYGPKFGASTIRHTWGAEDRGPTVEGFQDNAAVGRVVLNAATPAAQFRFTGAGVIGTTNAIYIDELVFGDNVDNFDPSFNATNVVIDSNIRIYYAEATADGVSIAEKLDGRNGGRFIWVPSYSGSFSGVTLDYGSGPLAFNRALVQSTTINSDGEGDVNAFDPTPIPAAEAFVSTPSIPNFSDLPLRDELANNFNPGFAGARGNYSGLFYARTGVMPESSGFFTAATTTKGRFSAKMRFGTRSTSFSGQFNSLGRWTNFVGSAEIELQLDLEGKGQITGRIITDEWTADLTADRSGFTRGFNPGSVAGKYTLLIQGEAGATDRPAGDGFGTVSVSKNGVLTFSAVLADGSKVSQKSALSIDGHWPLYAPLYRGGGVLIGWIDFRDEVETDFSGQTLWIKPEGAGGAYPLGFNHTAWTMGSRYTPPPNIRRGVAVLTDGDLLSSLTNGFALGKKFTASRQQPHDFSIAFTPQTGLFRGSVRDEEGTAIVFRGAYLEKAGFGGGFFLGFENSGRVHIRATP
ncbi:MAG TPA: hypothetical protein VEH04_19820 [Verrucomicrobiae bacterium]|nr:hypothetical protein [Verrucomicrobiae bacterium]